MAKPRHKGASQGHGECRTLTPEEIEALKQNLQPPLTKEQLAEKQRRDANRPDMSHMTFWAP